MAVETIRGIDYHDLPRAPKSPLSHREQARALRDLHTGSEMLRDAGGPVTRLTLAPRWVMKPVVVVTSPQGARDILGRRDGRVDKSFAHQEMRQLLGENLFDLDHERWLPRRRTLQPIFTKQHAAAFGGHMARAAETVAAGWRDGEQVNLDAECRQLILRALGRSVLGLDLGERAPAISAALCAALAHVANRGLGRPHAPEWLPTPARHRARAAGTALHRLAEETLEGCRGDPRRDAPLVQALAAVAQPGPRQALSDDEICHELVVFMVAGHDTSATALAYALWALGRNPAIQEKVRAEIDRLGTREPASEDVLRLGYTVQVVHEALRLCPPSAAISRVAMQDVAVDGYRVDAGTVLIVGLDAIHRDPALWDHPLTFDPDRFSSPNSTGRDRWQYLPFGAGPRSCIGDHFAVFGTALALATVIRHVEIESIDANFPALAPFTTIAAAPVRAWARARWQTSPRAVNNHPAVHRMLSTLQDRRPRHYSMEAPYFERARMEREIHRL